jgi:LPXTG-motif cell wall-anchored protein
MKRYIALLICLACFTGVAMADDVYPPAWRGSAQSMWARWNNWAGFPSPMAPDAWASTPGGLVAPSASAASPTFPPTGFDPLVHGRANVVTVSGPGSAYYLWFDLDNFDTSKPVKRIRVQITYNQQYSGFPSKVRVTGLTPGATTMEYSAVPTVTSAPDANGWVTSAYDFNFRPNPLSEKIEVSFYSTTFVDQVVIDTQCTTAVPRLVPTANSMTLLALAGLLVLAGGAALVLRRRSATA